MPEPSKTKDQSAESRLGRFGGTGGAFSLSHFDSNGPETPIAAEATPLQMCRALKTIILAYEIA
jgi:hypothetical protein